MKTVLVTAIGGDIAQAVATIIRETFPDWFLIGMDIHTHHGGELFVDKFIQAPRASDSNYNEWFNNLIIENNVDFCIPMSEAELLHFAQQKQRDIDGTKFIMANSKAIEVGSDKLVTYDYLGSIGCPRPWTLPAEELGDNMDILPCIFKSRRSAGSKAVFICNTHSDIKFYRQRFPHAIIQELLLPADKEVTCAIFRTLDGRTAVLQLLRTLVGGFTSWAQVIDDHEIKVQCTRLAEALDLKGSINAQLRLTDAGPRIFEINSRFSSTVLMRHRMGFQDVVWSLQDVLGGKVDFEYPPVGTTALRVQGAVILSIRPK